MKKFGKGLAFVLCILLLEMSCVSLLFLVPLSHSLGKENVKKIIMEMSSDELQDTALFADMLESELGSITSENEISIDDEVITKLMESDEVKELMAETSGSIASYVITGEEQKFITEEELKNLAEKAIDTINQESDYKITAEDKEKILQMVDENAITYLNQLSKVNMLEDNLSSEAVSALKILRFLLGKNLKIILLIIMVLSFLGIVLLKWKDMIWMKSCAKTILVASIISLCITLLLQIMNQLIFKEDILYVFKIFEKMIQMSFALAGSVAIGMILVLILYQFVIAKRKEEVTNEA